MAMNKCSKCYHRKVCIDSANYKNAEKCKNYVSASDVQEVRHGHWKEDVIYGEVPDYDCVCSICGKNGIPSYRYCPNCGCKMDGDTND